MSRNSQPHGQAKTKTRRDRKTAKLQDEVVALEADRSFLEQFEELAADQGGEAMEFLTKEIYGRPDRLSVLANIRGRKEGR
ncbi:MAG: hypothetical protein ACREE6_17330 [Limisphaerales bacterium]